MVGLAETWVVENKWGEVRELLQEGFRREMKEANKTVVRGRAYGGMIVGTTRGDKVRWSLWRTM